MRRALLVGCLVAGLVAAFALPGGASGSTGSRSAPSVIRLPSGRPVPTVSAFGPSGSRSQLAAPATDGCPLVRTHPGRPDNVRVNQDCGAALQGEEWVDVNPTDPSNVVVSQNDFQVGFNTTSVSSSTDSGNTFFRNYTPPGLNRTPTSTGGIFDYPRCSDPASAFDGNGNYFYACVAFNRPYGPESAIPIWRSNHCYKATFLHDPADKDVPCNELPQDNNPGLIADNQNDFDLFWDKELMAADQHPNSPFYNNVYLTVTRFDFGCGGFCEAPIYFFRSSDGGVTWQGKRISGINGDICVGGDAFDPSQPPGACNIDPGSSFPVVEPNGAVDVVFNNMNTPTLVAQHLFVRSTDGGHTWSKPVKVADDFDTQPFNTTDDVLPNGCAPFSQCLPPNGYRTSDFPSMGVDDTTGKLAVFWSDFRNGGPCTTDPNTGLPTVPCANYDNDMFVSVSTDHGHTWGPARKVSNGGTTAQWEDWGDVGENGKLYAGYYDRQFDSCESTGCNDITLAISGDDGATWRHQRITTSSMPNLTCDDNPVECGFLGDYMSVRYFGSSRNGTVYLVWADTRPRTGTIPEEDVYLAKVPVR